MPDSLTTARLILRRWKDADRAPFQALNADLRVMEFFYAPLTAEQSDGGIAGIEGHFERHGFGLFAVELRESQAFIGFIGLSVPAFEAPFMPAVEIGWRLAFDCWGRGLATEGARAVVRHAFENLDLAGLVSFTAAGNLRSRRVMEKIGMTRDEGGGFNHPHVPPQSPSSAHVLYRLSRANWQRGI